MINPARRSRIKNTDERLQELKETLRNWDAPRTTADCPYCHGTGLAPGDGKTKCGFCLDNIRGGK